jgi:hypothetical protein
MAAPKKADYSDLRHLWDLKVPVSEIAAAKGVTSACVSKAARRQNLPVRSGGGWDTRRKNNAEAAARYALRVKDAEIEVAARADRVAEDRATRSTGGRWTEAMDADLILHGDTYAGRLDFANRHGMTPRDALSRWHRLRA